MTRYGKKAPYKGLGKKAIYKGRASDFGLYMAALPRRPKKSHRSGFGPKTKLCTFDGFGVIPVAGRCPRCGAQL